MTLLKEKHPNRDFFIPNIFDNTPFKDDIASMEHPIFTLSTKKDVRELIYKNDNIDIRIKPSTDGLPTIFDKDILLYCGSLLMEQINKGVIPPKTLRISTHDLLVATNRTTDGQGYKLFKKALERLNGVSIVTNIKTNNKQISSGFHLIEKYRVIENSRVKKRMVKLEITLSEWFYNSIISKEVLTINRDYFRLRRPLERRIYEIARKHCGNQEIFKIALKTLHQKTGSTSSLKFFRYKIQDTITKNTLPDYKIYLEEKDMIVFRKRKKEQLIESNFDNSIILKTETLEKARKIALEAETGWDIYAIQEEFINYNKDKEDIKNIDGLFIGFVKKKVRNCP